MVDNLLLEAFPHNTQLISYADDLLLLIKHNDPEEISAAAKLSLQILEKWVSEFNMQFNIKKTQAILFTNKLNCPVPTLTLLGEQIPFHNTIKYLGLTIDKQLNWNAHIKIQTNKAKTTLQQLYRISGNTWGAPTDALKTIYKGAMVPILLYNCSV